MSTTMRTIIMRVVKMSTMVMVGSGMMVRSGMGMVMRSSYSDVCFPVPRMSMFLGVWCMVLDMLSCRVAMPIRMVRIVMMM